MLHHLAGATIEVADLLKRMAITQEPVIEHVLPRPTLCMLEKNKYTLSSA